MAGCSANYARPMMVPVCASTLTFMKKRFSIARSTSVVSSTPSAVATCSSHHDLLVLQPAT